MIIITVVLSAGLQSHCTNLPNKMLLFPGLRSANRLLSLSVWTTPVLAYPDFSILDTDASDSGIGAVLSQVGCKHVIAYANRLFTKSEQRYYWLLLHSQSTSDHIFWATISLYTQIMAHCSGCTTSRNQRAKWQYG